MDIHELEYAAKIIFALCRSHPELCPHDWSYDSGIMEWPNGNYENGITRETHRCNICGITENRINTTPILPKYLPTETKCPKCGENLYVDRCSRYYKIYNHICQKCGYENQIAVPEIL